MCVYICGISGSEFLLKRNSNNHNTFLYSTVSHISHWLVTLWSKINIRHPRWNLKTPHPPFSPNHHTTPPSRGHLSITLRRWQLDHLTVHGITDILDRIGGGGWCYHTLFAKCLSPLTQPETERSVVTNIWNVDLAVRLDMCSSTRTFHQHEYTSVTCGVIMMPCTVASFYYFIKQCS